MNYLSHEILFFLFTALFLITVYAWASSTLYNIPTRDLVGMGAEKMQARILIDRNFRSWR